MMIGKDKKVIREIDIEGRVFYNRDHQMTNTTNNRFDFIIYPPTSNLSSPVNITLSEYQYTILVELIFIILQSSSSSSSSPTNDISSSNRSAATGGGRGGGGWSSWINFFGSTSEEQVTTTTNTTNGDHNVDYHSTYHQPIQQSLLLARYSFVNYYP